MGPTGDIQSPTRIVVAEDNDDLRAAVVALLNDEADLQCVGEAADIDTVSTLTQELRPDVVVLDLELSGRSSMKLLATLPTREIACIIFSGYAHPKFVQQAIDAGARDFVVKTGDFAVLVASIRRHART
jgi:two-component system, NarL family, response regulator DesR